MVSEATIQIAYAGTLRYHDGGEEQTKSRFFAYQRQNINYNTRSGYFLFRAISALHQAGKINPKDLHVHLWGDIDPRNDQLAKDLGISEYITISGFISKQESMNLLAKADILFLPAESAKKGQKPLFIPGKVYDYLRLGKPILALMDESESREIVMKSGLGILAHPSDIEEISLVLLRLVDQKNQLAELCHPNQGYIDSFRMETKTGELAAIFDEVLKQP